jgi:beta-ureidopropionase
MNEIRIASLECLGDGGVGAALRRAQDMIVEACFDRPDLICLPELFAWTSLTGDQKIKSAEPVNGPFCTTFAGMAAEQGVNILTPLLEKEGNRVYNSLVWLDRKGRVTGVYRKAFPTDYEMAEGIDPGPLDFEVFQTEFGPIGACICFDINFKDVIERLASQQVKLVIFPTMFQGLALMQAWAKLYRMYFVSAAAYPYAAVVDPLGRVLAAPWNHDPILQTTLNLDYVVLHRDRNRDLFPAVKATYGSSVTVDQVYIESCALLASRHSAKSARELVEEFNLELEESYYQRSAELCRGKRK